MSKTPTFFRGMMTHCNSRIYHMKTNTACCADNDCVYEHLS